nr:TetR family transcriptional regulator [Streptomyces sp. Ag109_O5-10]
MVGAGGSGAVSVREVQRSAGVSSAVAYRHFRGRDALLPVVAQECAGMLLADHIATALEGVAPFTGEPAAVWRGLPAAGVAHLNCATGGTQLNPWDPLPVWVDRHGLATLRLDAVLFVLREAVFAQARDRVLAAITAAVPLGSSPPPGRGGAIRKPGPSARPGGRALKR